MRSFFWSVFSRTWTEYRYLLRKSLYSVQIRENRDQKKHCIWTLFTQCKSVEVRSADNFTAVVLELY